MSKLNKVFDSPRLPDYFAIVLINTDGRPGIFVTRPKKSLQVLLISEYQEETPTTDVRFIFTAEKKRGGVYAEETRSNSALTLFTPFSAVKKNVMAIIGINVDK